MTNKEADGAEGRTPMNDLPLILGKFLRLLEFTRDITRSESDSAFVKNGGKITYVFDENVFEMFVDPAAQSRFVELFHSNIWFQGMSASRDLRLFTGQSALVTSEYLFAGSLPGQESGRIYMTEWHFGELRSRRREYTTWLEGEIDRLSKQDAKPPRSRVASPSKEADAIDQLTKQDLESFAKRTDDVGALERFRDARIAARALVDDTYWGPLHQLKRIGSPEIAGRIVPLSARYRPSQLERVGLRDDMRAWLRRFRDEKERRDRQRQRDADDGGHERERYNRSPRGLENDADTLAYLTWIVRSKLGPKERLVFVTGDSLLFDVYRTWYVDQPPGEPFLMRRISQYAPIINLNDAQSDIAGCKELFQSTREAVEAALFVFNLSGPSKSLDQLGMGREHLAAALSRYRVPEDNRAVAAFVSNLTREWVDQRQKDFASLIHLWQQMERFVIGIHYDLIAKRYNDVSRRRMQDVLASEGQEAFVNYLKEILNELVSGSIRLFFPLATNFIRSVLGNKHNHAGTKRPRAPVVLRLLIPNSIAFGPISEGAPAFDSSLDVHDILDRSHSGDEGALAVLDVEKNPLLQKRPDIVYMIAAILALEAEEWSEAERFAELANSADPLIEVDVASLEDDRFEARYLFALSKRFRLGSLDPRASWSRANVWHNLLDAAVDSLTACELHHSRLGETLRHLRAVSERAAVRLFYVSWSVVTTELGRRGVPNFPDSATQLELALSDLRKCLELEVEAARSGIREKRHDFFERVQKQYTVNLTAAQLMSHALASGGVDGPKGLTASEIEFVNARINTELIDLIEDLPLAAQADLRAFLALETSNQRDRQNFLNWAAQQGDFELVIDRSVLPVLVQVVRAASSA